VKHFSLADWADYVRGVVTVDRRVSMQKHLDGGCSSCQETVGMWTSMADFGKREVSYEPTLDALRIAESYIVPLKLAMRSRQGIQLAPITFDSFDRPVYEGIRGVSPGPRQLMYQFAEFFIDLRLEPKPSSNLIVLAGQIVDSRQPTVGVAEVPVSLVKGGETLLQTTTNQQGEFQFMFQSVNHLMLLAEIKDSALLMLLPPDRGEAA
jgi:hypothetical protein